jgi:hypothetical protein
MFRQSDQPGETGAKKHDQNSHEHLTPVQIDMQSHQGRSFLPGTFQLYRAAICPLRRFDSLRFVSKS